MNKTVLSATEEMTIAANLAKKIIAANLPTKREKRLALYGIPRGGVNAAEVLAKELRKRIHNGGVIIVDNIKHCDIVVDDILDSGKTMTKHITINDAHTMMEPKSNRFTRDYHYAVFVNKNRDPKYSESNIFAGRTAEPGKWVEFSWETARGEGPAEDAITRLLQVVGEDPTREGLLETPKRVIKAWMEWTEGYRMNLDDIIKVFQDGSEGVDEMIMEKRIPFTSHCEHHMAPFTGYVTIAYIPKKGILGLSKMNRVTEMFSRRLQVQERMTKQIADALESKLDPLGVAVLVEAEHSCVCSRGVRHHGCSTVTSTLRGVFKTQPATRAEFYSLAKD